MDQFAEPKPEIYSVDTKVLKSVCRSCHGGCGTLLHVKDDTLVKVEGDPDSPFNQGRLCPIGNATREMVYHPDRLKYPMRRKGERGSGEWERLSWDDALGEIADKLTAIKNEFGAEAVHLGTGTGRHHIRWVSRFAFAFGSPNWSEPGFAQCFHPRVNACTQTMGDFPVSDFLGPTPAECICFWGHQPLNSGPDGETRFNARDAFKNNPKTIVIDPRETFLAKKADLWLQLRPGTDDALALAMIHVIINEGLEDTDFVTGYTHGFDALAERVTDLTPEWAEEITWAPAGKIREAARMFATIKPALMEWGVALEQTPNCIQTVRAVSLIPSITGNIDVPGGWVFGMHGLGPVPSLIENLSPEQNAKRLGFENFKMLCGEGAALPAAHIPTVLQAMRTGEPYPVKAFLIFGNNTLTTYGDSKTVYESLMKLDFMVNTDIFMTPTAALADIVLPAAFWPEINEVCGLPTIAGNVIAANQQAVRTHECKSDEEIFSALARRLNLDVGTETPEEVYEQQMQAGGSGLSFEDIKQVGFHQMPITYRKYEADGFNTPTGKLELYSTRLEEMGYDPLPSYAEPPESPLSTPELAKDFPLILTTGGRNPFFFNSEGRQVKSCRKGAKQPTCEIHPATAAQFGITDGAWMWIETARGKIRQIAKVTNGINPRVINTEFGWWFPEDPAPDYGVWKSNANVLTSVKPPFDPQMGTYQLRALLCKVSNVVAGELAE
ncbi:MAG: molybdopterin-dependent oxidoreductase [Rhodospirillaceae bacterium]|nr:molybdopterin-dependent oxidoreductase [Rhodospirillaceae bacterium]